MFSKIFICALAASPLVAAHGKVTVMTGNAGGNTTALGIKGGIVPGPGKNKVTEVDTTVFNSKAIMTDGLGKTSAGANTLAGMKEVMAQSGSTLPQATGGGTLSGTLHIVTTDGAGPYKGVVDPTGTGAFSKGTAMDITTQVPGKNGNIAAPKQRRFVARMLVSMGIMKRASNVNEDYPIAMTVPTGTKCTGTLGDQKNVCLVKVANPSKAGPFGGVFAFQMADSAGNTTGSGSTTGSSSTTGSGSTTASGDNAAPDNTIASSGTAASGDNAAPDNTTASAKTAGSAKKPKPTGAKFRV